MDSYPVSDALIDLLDRKGMRSETVGAVTKRGMKKPGAADKGAHRQWPADREVSSGIRLCWNNPHMTKATGRRTSRAALVICE